MRATADSNTEAGGNPVKPMRKIWVELLTKATLCAAMIGLLAGIVAAFFFLAG